MTDNLKDISINRKLITLNGILKNNKTLMYKITYEQKNKDENGPKLIEIKDFVFEYFLKLERNICKCCINFLREVNDYSISCYYFTQRGISENQYFKKSEITMFINLNENYNCNKLNEYKKNF